MNTSTFKYKLEEIGEHLQGWIWRAKEWKAKVFVEDRKRIA